MTPTTLLVSVVWLGLLTLVGLVLVLRPAPYSKDETTTLLEAERNLVLERERELRQWVDARFDTEQRLRARLENKADQVLRDFHAWHPTDEDHQAREILDEFRASSPEDQAQLVSQLRLLTTKGGAGREG